MRRIAPPRRALRAERAVRPHGGFTLVELVLAMALLGLLGAIAGPRFFSRNDVDEHRFTDEVTALLRHGRRVAVASGCAVEARFDGATLRLAQQTGCAGAVFDVPVVDPGDGAAETRLEAPPGVSFASDVDPMRFDALGQALDGTAVSDVHVTVGGRSLLIVGGTGFVRAL